MTDVTAPVTPLDPSDKLPDHEQIARIIYSTQLIDGNQLSPSAFTLRDMTPPEDYISVQRICIEPPVRKKAKRIRKPSKEARLYGYAQLIVGPIHGYRYDDTYSIVKPYPESFKAHAGIHLLIGNHICAGAGDAEREEFLNFTSFLAQISTIVPFSSPAGSQPYSSTDLPAFPAFS